MSPASACAWTSLPVLPSGAPGSGSPLLTFGLLRVQASPHRGCRPGRWLLGRCLRQGILASLTVTECSTSRETTKVLSPVRPTLHRPWGVESQPLTFPSTQV